MRGIQITGALAIWTVLGVGCADDKDGSTASAASEASDDSTADEPTSSGESTGEPTTGGPGGSPCELFAENIAMCDPEVDPAELAADCEAQQTSAGPACSAAFDAYVECFSTASCGDEQSCMAVYEDYLACTNPVGETCAAYGARLEECMDIPAFEGGAVCQQQLDELAPNPACHDGYEAFIVCYTKLSCADIETATGCEAEMNAFAGCGG